MKKNHSLLIPVVFSLFLFSNAGAQDGKNVNSKVNHVLADTTFLHAVEVTLQPGEKTDMHTHPAHFFYALTDGKLKVHHKDGKEEVVDLKQGMAMAGRPEGQHVTENVGNKTVKFLLVELKDYPYKAEK